MTPVFPAGAADTTREGLRQVPHPVNLKQWCNERSCTTMRPGRQDGEAGLPW